MSSKNGYANSVRKQQMISEQRRKLEELRLQTESQNTKLLKIQQKEREVEAEYQKQRKNMQQTLGKLSLQQEQFALKQQQTTEEFNGQKEQIFANDRKKALYLKQKQELKNRNAQRTQQIAVIQQNLKAKKQNLEQIRKNIKMYQIYEQFLKQVRSLSQEFGPSDLDQFSVMLILDRYRTMQKKKIELAHEHIKVAEQKEQYGRATQNVRKQRQEQSMHFAKTIKDLKQKIDVLSEQNVQQQSQLEGHLTQNNQRQREVGQIIFSIRGLYLTIVPDEKQPKTIVEMLATIKQERKRLREHFDLYYRTMEDSKKSPDRRE